MSAKNVEIVTASRSESFIPLNKLKKSPKNARKTPHSEAISFGMRALSFCFSSVPSSPFFELSTIQWRSPAPCS